jgi:antirestriction protein ArdC
MTRSATRPAPSGRASGDRANLHDEITERIIAELEAGRLPWVQPWGTSGVAAPLALPKNAATRRRYSGINVLILWGAVVERGYAGQSWLTFRQALALGGSVRKGERGTTVVYADCFIPGEERQRAQETGKDARAIHFLKRFTVFNVEQYDGLPPELLAAAPPADTSLIEPRVQALIATSGADLRIGGKRAYYDVLGDFIRVPPPQAYFQPIDWHRTALHELGHWTGHESRLGREISNSFGSKNYAKEELVAELMVERYRPVRDSGGPGLHRGGCGIEKVYRLLERGEVSIHDDREVVPPWGINGGLHGGTSSKWLRRAGESEAKRIPSKIDNLAVAPDDVVIFKTAGSGGWGDPLDRDPVLVARDVRHGTVSAERAAQAYGVVLDAEGQPDAARTAEARRTLRSTRGPASAFDFGSFPGKVAAA